MIERMKITQVYQEKRSEQVIDIYFSVKKHGILSVIHL